MSYHRCKVGIVKKTPFKVLGLIIDEWGNVIHFNKKLHPNLKDKDVISFNLEGINAINIKPHGTMLLKTHEDYWDLLEYHADAGALKEVRQKQSLIANIK